MNFLAHYLLATRSLPAQEPLPFYVVGTALPDLVPLASARTHLRQAIVANHSPQNAEAAALQAGVLVHLATDTAFHKTEAFARAQAEVSGFLNETNFEGIRVRRFFLAHVLVELALDAVLIRADPGIAEGFYSAFMEANYAAVTCWTEAVVGKPLPHLPSVLTRFAESRYLVHYREPEGVATGLSRLCGRARQDTFEGENYARLVEVVQKSIATLKGQAEALLGETAEAVQIPPP
jgi:hypothetical protein